VGVGSEIGDDEGEGLWGFMPFFFFLFLLLLLLGGDVGAEGGVLAVWAGGERGAGEGKGLGEEGGEGETDVCALARPPNLRWWSGHVS
jgi:hypothetical protein